MLLNKQLFIANNICSHNKNKKKQKQTTKKTVELKILCTVFEQDICGYLQNFYPGAADHGHLAIATLFNGKEAEIDVTHWTNIPLKRLSRIRAVDRFVPRPPFWTGRYQWPCKNSSDLERAFQLFYEYITQYMTWVVRWLSILLFFLLWSIIQTDEVDYIGLRKK